MGGKGARMGKMRKEQKILVTTYDGI